MRAKLCLLGPVLVAIRLVTCLEESFLDSNEAQEAKNHQQQQGSWAHWWSYDGISGPDYWNINKRWRLCRLGRKQSPVDLRTERLVYDHLLGPIHLDWSQHALAGSSAEQPKQKQNQVRLRLLNSGRGLEAWLPEAQSQGQLVLSRGPLSYQYGLFKIELHSAQSALNQQLASSAGGGAGSAKTAPNRRAPNELNKDAASRAREELGQEREQEQQDDEEAEAGMAPDYLRAQRSSEHLIDGRPFEAELQLHFYNKRLASSASEAQLLANQEEGRPSLFAAISVFLITNDGGGNQTGASPVDELMLNNLGSLENQGDSLELTVGRDLLDRLVPDRRHYITYQGSMNRPPCSESVDWIISNRPLRMDLAKFRALFERLNTNQENVRPVKPLNRRLLRTTINNLQSGAQRAHSHSSSSPSSSSSSRTFVNQQARPGGPLESLGPLEVGTGSGFASLAPSNCSGANNHEQCPGMAKEPLGSCSMRPRYVYQLTYTANSPTGR